MVNSSRSFGVAAKSFITNDFGANLSEKELNEHTERLVHRHIVWLYQLRKQLLIPTTWEHGGLRNKRMKQFFVRRRKHYGLGLVKDQEIDDMMKCCMSDPNYEKVKVASNPATAIIDMQGKHLDELRHHKVIDDFRYMELFKLLKEFYVEQGKCERIKKFPLPRQYANMSAIFMGIFLLPLETLAAFHQLGNWGMWASIVANVIVGWVYMVMEHIGDYSENPFEGLGNDIPMLSLCRTIEIDLREMLGEEYIHKPIVPVQGVLM